MLAVFAVASMGVYGIVLAGWASNSKYSLLGGLRSSAQMISYELSYGISLATIILLANSMSLREIVDAQAGYWFGFIPKWFVFLQPVGFVVYAIAGVAETNRAPFDFPEAEQELVAGYHTEYSSMAFAMFFLAEYINMITVSAVATNLFLGGWHGPFLPPEYGFVWFLIKIGILLFGYLWLRWTLPRLRYDQLMAFGWKVLLPVATRESDRDGGGGHLLWALSRSSSTRSRPSRCSGRCSSSSSATRSTACWRSSARSSGCPGSTCCSRRRLSRSCRSSSTPAPSWCCSCSW